MSARLKLFLFCFAAALVSQAGVWCGLVGEIDRGSGLICLFFNCAEYTGLLNTRTIPAGEFIAATNWLTLTSGMFGATAVNFSDIASNNPARLYCIVSP
jgi:hypothetical protein